MIRHALSGLIAHWRRHPGQLATLMTGLALATALWSGVQAINAEARSAYDRAAATLGQDQLARLTGAAGGAVEAETYVALRRAGVEVSPVITGVLRLGDQRLRIWGYDPLTIPQAAAPRVTPGDEGQGQIDLAAFLTEPGLLLVAEGTVLNDLPPGFPGLQVSGDVPPGSAFTDIATAGRLLQTSDPTYLLVAPDHSGTLPGDTGLRLEPPRSGEDIGRLTDSFHLNLTAFGLLAFAVGLFIVHGAIGLATEQRRTGIRTLRALGVPLRAVLGALALELAVIAVLAGAAGLILGYLIAGLLMPGVAGTLQGLYGADVPGTLRFSPEWAALAGGMTLAGAAMAGAQAFARIAAMPLLQPAQPRAWAVASGRGMARQGLAALALGLVALAILGLGDGLVAGFAFLAALLLASAIALPVVLSWLLGRISRLSWGVRAEWMLADARQQMPSLSLALMALLLALAANIGVSTMVGSFRVTFIGWLDQRLAAEIYVTTASPAEAEATRRYLEGRAEAVLPNVWAETDLFGRPADIYGIVDHPTYRDHWPLLSATPDVWDAVARGTGALVNEQTARRETLSLGDPLPIAPDVTLPVVGIYSDYGNPNGQAIIALDLFRALYPEVEILRFGLRVPPEQVDAVTAGLREEVGLPVDAVVNQAQVKAFSIGVFERTFQITGALNVLTLAVAGFAIWTSLLTLANMRLPQVAPVWAQGMTRRVLARMELGRAVLLAGLTFLLSVPVGLALAWALLAVVNVEAFGWRLPMRLFPGDWLGLLALALVAALIAAAFPARRLARLGPDRLLRVFANDR